MSSSTKGAVLITGCSDDGAGSALAAEFDAHGYRVFATSRSLKTMSKVENLPNIKTLELDITKTAQIRAAAETVASETGGELAYLVNCAARNYFMPLLDQDIEDCKAVFETNVWGQLAVTQAFAPLLMKAKGTVVFITSVSGYLNVPYQGLYAASKRSEQIMAETLRLELAPFHVKVLSVVTGALKTMGQTHFEDWKLPAGSLYSPIEPTIKDRARGQEGAPRMEPCDYAKGVVNDIIRGRTGTIWHGASVGAVRFGTSWLPTWMMDSGVQMKTGLDVLAQQNK
ncbi:nadph-dependent 1-acyldihydroxyacetone phosphate reductase protein [Pochonia chlamydosporia 170]|uniref:Nadph-dependent 1-acyldihydroxyacetone phosphate reductase protein n=1 Tax=Pochonia chlamydosporia 170 TaxID=1380566 RepID=A0A179F295_METCM|nr:nadph-dependent 1-acyldihydroxyacetone phosphate reductase protein [Pochonia chlamydosporia 170]OAQ59557.1 nadph-dependent 1-acyldihydroxyacetone phosphate reductase protein [Pochonia chlamydosporia 170]